MSIYWLMCSVVMCFFVVYGIDFIVKLTIFCVYVCMYVYMYACCIHVNIWYVCVCLSIVSLCMCVCMCVLYLLWCRKAAMSEHQRLNH